MENNNFIERRKYERIALRSRVNFRITSSPEAPEGSVTEYQATGKNLGVAGILISSDKELTPGTLVEIAIFLPGRDEPVRNKGQVRWCCEAESSANASGAFDAGIKFLTIDKEYVMLLLKYVCGDLEDEIIKNRYEAK